MCEEDGSDYLRPGKADITVAMKIYSRLERIWSIDYKV
jgi:hypothetical protein